MMKNALGDMSRQALNAIVAPTVECLDVDGIVRRIDINELLDRVDFNQLLDRIDWNRHLNRIDWNQIIGSIDVNEIMARSDLGSLITQSTSGVLTHILDVMRARFIQIDLFLYRVARWQWENALLPPRPGRQRQRDQIPVRYPKHRLDQALAVQGRYAGFASKGAAMLLDLGAITVTFLCSMIVIQLTWVLFLHDDYPTARHKVRKSQYVVVTLYAIWWFLHFFLSVWSTGQTLGMAVMGLQVVPSRSHRMGVSWKQALIRTAVLSLTLFVSPFMAVIGFFRRDGRMLHDIIADTGIIYKWNARMAKLRERARIRMEYQQRIWMRRHPSSFSEEDEENENNNDEDENDDRSEDNDVENLRSRGVDGSPDYAAAPSHGVAGTTLSSSDRILRTSDRYVTFEKSPFLVPLREG